MAKKIIDDTKHDAFVERNWQAYQKAQAKKTASKTTKKKATTTKKKSKGKK